MSETDWADEEAQRVGLKLHWDHKTDCVKIASALRAAERQGVIKGLREAADDMLKTNDDECVQWAAWLRLRADELEKQ
jgi:hypothetical protein